MKKVVITLLILPLCLIARENRSGITYILDTELLFWARSNDAPNKCLAVVETASQGSGSCEAGSCAINARDVVSGQGYQPGLRLTFSIHPDQWSTWEARYTGLLEWESGASKECTGNSIEFNFNDGVNPTVDWIDDERIEAHLESQYWDLEANYWAHITPQRVSYFSVSGFIGARYIDFREDFNMASQVMGDSSDYLIDVRNRLFGPQVGGVYESMLFPRFFWTLGVAIGGLGNFCQQNTFWGDNNNTEILIDQGPHKATGSFFGELAASFNYEFFRRFSVIASYQAILITNIAQGMDQVEYDSDNLGQNKVFARSTLILHGASGGFSFVF